MLELINQHLDRIEELQADLEQRLRQALEILTPEEIFDNYDDLPDEIVDALEGYLSAALLAKLQDESVVFLEGDDDADMEANEEKTRNIIIALFESYLSQVYIISTSILASIHEQAFFQETLGRSREAIVAELQQNKAGLGKQFASLTTRLVTLSNSFIGSASGVVAMGGKTSRAYAWIVVLDGKECADCHPRHGESRTYEEWVEQGLPRTGWSVCGGYCRCVLFPLELFEKDKFGPVQRGRRS